MVDANSGERLFRTEQKGKDRFDDFHHRGYRAAGVFWNEGWRIARSLGSFINAEGTSAILRRVQRHLYGVPVLNRETETRGQHRPGNNKCQPPLSTDLAWFSKRTPKLAES